MNPSKGLQHTLQENSRELALEQAILELDALEVPTIQVYDGPWIDIEVDKSSGSPHCSVRMHSRGGRSTNKNLQIQFIFEVIETRHRLQVLLGDAFGPKSKGIPLARENLTLVWESDTGLGNDSLPVGQEIRDALADQLSRIIIELRLEIVRVSEEKHLTLNHREVDNELAEQILTLRRETMKDWHPSCDNEDSNVGGSGGT
ncbi:MAG: hypothetical protein ABL890_02540 [Candidatus Peribacteraceae bacterium]